MAVIQRLYLLLISHFIGDYVLQTDFLAKTKGENWYHLIIHSLLYTVPFYIVFGFDIRLAILFASHMLIDAVKARHKFIGYAGDQILHLMVLEFLYYIFDTSI